MANFKPHEAGLKAFEKQAQRALQDGVNAVSSTHGGEVAATIRRALRAEMKRRGFVDFEPGDELVRQVQKQPRRP